MPTSSVADTPAFLANPGQTVNAAAVPPNYPIPTNRKVGNFAVRVLTSETLADDLTIELVQDVAAAGTGGTVLKTHASNTDLSAVAAIS